MGIFKFFKKRPSKKILVKREYRGDWGTYTFPTDKGDVTISAIVHVSSQGAKTVLYECLGEHGPEITSEDKFVKDVSQIVQLVSSGRTNEEVIGALLENPPHYGALIMDVNVRTYISELYLVLVAMNEYCNKDDLLQRLMQYAEKNFQIINTMQNLRKKRK